MFKALIVVTLVVCCQSQLDIPKRLDRLSDALGLVPAPVPNFAIAQPGLAVAQPVAVAPGPIVSAINRPIGLAAPAQYAWGGLSSIPIQKFRSQEVLPIQDLGVVNGGPQVIQVKGTEEPVLVHFQSQSAPVQVETSHIPSPPGETTVTQTQDEPHRVIHEIIRPVIQEVREIIQPYRRVTQEIRPVQEEVQTDVATNAGGAVSGGAVAVAAPAALSVAGPTYLTGAVRTPITVAAPHQGPLSAGVIAAPAPYITGSYIQQFIDQLGLRRLDTPLYAARPQIQIQEAPVAKAVAVEAVEPITSEAAENIPTARVAAPKLVGGGSLYSRKYAEY